MLKFYFDISEVVRVWAYAAPTGKSIRLVRKSNARDLLFGWNGVAKHSVVAAPVAVTTGSCPSHLGIAAGLRKILAVRAQDFLNSDFACSSSGCAPAVSLRFSHLHCLPDRHAVEFTSCSSAFVHSHSNHSDCPAGASLSTR